MKKTTVTSNDSEILIPGFSLPSTRGGARLGPSDFRQQQNLVLFFFDSWKCHQCRRILRSLREHAGAYRELDTAILGVAQVSLIGLMEAGAELEPDVTLLADEDGRVTAAYQGDGDAGIILPFLVVADRYGAFYGRLEFASGEDLDHRELASLLEFIETQCPECGVPRGDDAM